MNKVKEESSLGILHDLVVERFLIVGLSLDKEQRELLELIFSSKEDFRKSFSEKILKINNFKKIDDFISFIKITVESLSEYGYKRFKNDRIFENIIKTKDEIILLLERDNIEKNFIWFSDYSEKLWMDQKEIYLRPKLFKILKFLDLQDGKICTLKDIINFVYGEDYSIELSSINGSLTEMKLELKKQGVILEIKNISGVGFCIPKDLTKEEEVLKNKNKIFCISEKHLFFINGEMFSEFSKTEFGILKFFYENQNNIFTKDNLYEKIWNDEVENPQKIPQLLLEMRKKLPKKFKNIIKYENKGYIMDEKNIE